MTVRDKIRKLRRTYRFINSLGTKGCYKYSKFILSQTIDRQEPYGRVEKPEVLLITLPKATTKQPPLGIAYIKSYLVNHGVSCRCIDFNNRLYKLTRKHESSLFNQADGTFLDQKNFDRFCKRYFNKVMDHWVSKILEVSPRFLGISVTSYLTYFPLKYIVKSIKSINPDIQIILGGPSCMADGTDFIKKDLGDIVVKGDGEQSFLDVINNLKHNKSLRSISGLVYKEHGKVIDTGSPKIIENLDNLPFPDFDDFVLGDYESEDTFRIFPTLPLFSSRGCTGNCKFCNIRYYWSSFRDRSAQNIFTEMKHQKNKYGTSNFSFNDSMVNTNLSCLEQLCDLIIHSKEAFHWSASYKIMLPTPKKLFLKMVKAGCHTLSIGIESGSERVRKDMNKPVTTKMLRQQLKIMHQAGIDVHMQFIVGYPTETRSDFDKSIGFIRENKKYLKSITFGIPCALLPGSYLSQNIDKEGLSFDKRNDWYYHDNTMEERSKRIVFANKVGQQLGLVSHDDANNKLIKLARNTV